MGISVENQFQSLPKQTGPRGYFLKKVDTPSFGFNNANVPNVNLRYRVRFEDLCKTLLSKINRTIRLLRKRQNFLPREVLTTIYKAFVRPHLDYGNVLFDQNFNTPSHEKLESIQYNVYLCSNRKNKWYFQRETLSRISFRMTSALSQVQKALSFL